MKRPPLTQDRLKELLNYAAESGTFTWRVSKRYGINPGDVAGHVRQDANLSHYKCVVISIDGRQHLAHRLAWLWFYGELPDHDIDHIDGDATNNKISNLRPASKKQNLENAKLQSNNTTGHRGVYLAKRTGKFFARVRHFGVAHHLGYFDSIEEAAEAARAGRHNLFTHYHERDELK